MGVHTTYIRPREPTLLPLKATVKLLINTGVLGLLKKVPDKMPTSILETTAAHGRAKE